MTHFDDLGLSGQALQAVAQLGYSTPTPVQEQAIPKVLEGRDLIAAAKTGTGKTAAFSLPTMDKLGHAKGNKGPLMLVVTPTREAAQAEEVNTRRAKRGGRKVAEKPASGTAHAARKHSNADHGSQQKRGNGSRNASANRAKTSNASGAQAHDFRPGRAHRAQVAHQRNRRR